ncbi:DUF4290 domain-containing protein [Flavobacterium sp.]|uniref:DUF4290 domain-containing protein n=1 Tax=Flavobacterium sp. TaxID=239 RepID=UPI0035285631
MENTTLEYNSQRTELIIPEYGRHLQKLIDQITVIENREERNKAAQYAIAVMGTLNPHLRDVPDFQHKLWDQLFIMSNFKLDVDSPFPIPSKEVLNQKPEPLPYPQNFPKYRFYGNNISRMINVAVKWENGDLKTALILVIANHMKKSYLSWNKETVEDDVIFEHLYELSNGKINLKTSNEELSTSQNLIKVNKKASNKSQHGKNNGSKNQFKKKNNQRNSKRN